MSRIDSSLPNLLTSVEVASIFRALGDGARLSIVRRLIEVGPQTVSELVVACGQRQPSVSKHLTQLHDCGLASRLRIGREVVYSVSLARVGPLVAHAEGFGKSGRAGRSCSCATCWEGPTAG